MSTLSPKSSHQLLRGQKRSDAQGDGDRSSGPAPPLPIVDRNYTSQDLQDQLVYTDQVLRNSKRRLSPIEARALKLYEDTCARLLDLEQGEVGEGRGKELEAMKNEWKSTLCMYEQSMQYTACLIATRSSDAQELQDQLIMLQKAAFYS
ncbi:uncharacterized protein ASPGLDRAFT_31924 [Aspergillus glaucus CBS 516.65]|uniref:Uncharacterized protein n=1 Tax=Aspergillus glaucus CBS 516.65 TaxID=1160497 RepID=A0A1L9VY17_ASPGL|nr:hypothetical protein ASPGLDRAFT_31924 [Aspergillus glaucus CBS 516.65]OJJ88818.1 hypothetical protein ASPGLDRAFT_31924 [Aspergillus glaucus CBS 516.65]